MSKNELLLYGEIGRDVTAATVAAALQAAGRARVQVRVHSAGGSLFEGLAIHSRLASHPGGVDITVDGLACSAASLVVMAGKHVAMSQSAWLMLHDPSASLAGGADDLRDMADLLDRTRTACLDIYAGKTGLDRAQLATMMQEETWLDAGQAVELGFANAVVPAAKVAASVDLSRFQFQHVPEGVLEMTTPTETPATLAELRAAMGECDPAFIVAQLEAGATVVQAQAAMILRLRDEASKHQAAPRRHGVAAIPTVPVGSTIRNQDGDFWSAVNELVAAGKSRKDAIARVARECPDLHKEMLLANRHNGSRAECRQWIDDRFHNVLV